MNTTVRFDHGLGDAVNFAHTLLVYQKRGHTFKVACSPDKAPIFRAVGAETCGLDDCPAPDHPWHNPRQPAMTKPGEDWVGNKAGWNWGVSPMPLIGIPGGLWPELVGAYVENAGPFFRSTEGEGRAEGVIDDLPEGRPVVLLHANANTTPHKKDLSPGWLSAFYAGVMDKTDATILVLDWDDRTYTPSHARIRHLAREWGYLPGLAGLYSLITRANLFVGVDSGPLHFLRFTNTLGLGLWRGHNPTSYALPRPLTVHVAPPAYAHDNAVRRAAFNTITDFGVGGAELCPGFVADQVAGMVGINASVFLPARARPAEVMLKYFLRRCRGESGPGHLVDRQRSFTELLRKLTEIPAPVVVETGSIRSPEDWAGAGFFGYLMGFYLTARGAGELHTVEIDPERAEFARTWQAPFADRSTVHVGDSRDWLKGWRVYLRRPIDVLYCDSADVGTPGYQDVCLDEVQLATDWTEATPCVTAPRLILIDDTFMSRGTWDGKGAKAVPYLLAKGWRVDYSGYQTLLSRPRG